MRTQEKNSQKISTVFKLLKNRMIHATNVEIDEKVVPSIYQFSMFFITLKTTKYL